MATAEIKAVITADDQASKTLSGFGTKLGDVTVAQAALTAGLVAAGKAVFDFGVDSVKAFTESQDAMAQTNAVLKSTGGAAGVTADEVGRLATELQNSTRFSDEQVRSAENMLLTFTNIGKDVFPDTTKAVADMATAMGTDLKSTSIQVGKALQDPINGVTALQRVGVRLTDSQKDLVKSLVDSGQTMEAQKVILGELQKEFGGSAEAAGSTFAGGIEKLKNQFNDMQEKVGEVLAGGLLAFSNWLTNNNPIVEFFTNNMWALWAVIGALGTALLTVAVPALIAAAGAAWTFAAGVIAATWPILAIGAAIGAVAYLVVTNWETIKSAFGNAINWIHDRVEYMKSHFFESIGYIIGFFATLPAKLLALVVLAMISIVQYIAGINWGNVFRTIGDGFVGVLGWIWNSITGLFDRMLHMDWGSIFANLGKGVANGILGLIEGVLNGALSGIPGVPHISLPRFAKGVQNFGGGLAIVGEQGPEVVSLPRGSSVTPNDQIGTQVSQASNINISISGAFMGTPDEARSFARKIVDGMQDIANAKNTTVAEMLS